MSLLAKGLFRESDVCGSASGAKAHLHSRPIGVYFVENGRLTPAETDQILRLQQSENIRFGDAAIELGLLSPDDVRLALSDQFDYHYLPDSDASLSQDLVAAYAPFTPFVEELRGLRSQLQLRWFSGEAQRRALTIVSPGRNEGRSFIAANLAIVFSQLSTPTLLVDADLRNPCQHQLFKMGSRLGLSDILAGRCGLEAIRPIASLQGLSLLTAGTSPPNPQELLGRSAFKRLLETLRKEFDHVIFDSPPGAFYADAQIISANAGAALLLAREHQTVAPELTDLMGRLQENGTTLVGSIINQCPG